MVKKTSYMFITGPDVIKTVTGEDIGLEELGGTMVHETKSGVAHFACDSDAQAIEMIRDLLTYLPSNYREPPPVADLGDDPNRTEVNLDDIIPDDTRKGYDMKDVIRAIVDKAICNISLRNLSANILCSTYISTNPMASALILRISGFIVRNLRNCSRMSLGASAISASTTSDVTPRNTPFSISFINDLDHIANSSSKHPPITEVSRYIR